MGHQKTAAEREAAARERELEEEKEEGKKNERQGEEFLSSSAAVGMIAAGNTHTRRLFTCLIYTTFFVLGAETTAHLVG